MKRSTTMLAVLVIFVLLGVSCASPESIDACVEVQNQRGFLYGLLHGFLAPLTFLVSLIVDSVTMYEVNNSGGWYDFGFLLGIGGFSSGVFKSSRKKKR